MQPLTNTKGFGLAMAVWLAHDEYDAGQEAHPDKDVISVTGLLKPTRQIILANRIPASDRLVDVSDLIASRFGHAVHDSIEHAWRSGYQTALKRLNYPQKMIDKIRINPEDHELSEDIIPVYLEQRFFRELDGIVISGKFDQIIAGELNDTKTTSVYTYLNRTKTDDYQIQGSIYRWINPEKVTSDVMLIQHVFTDWQSSQARINPDYPQSKIQEVKIQLLSLQETENWIRAKIREIMVNQNLPEPELIRCTDKELWKSDPVYKYYSDPKKAQEGGRATKNFPNYPAAAVHLKNQGKGVIVTIPGQVKACGYCPAAEICTQRLEYEQSE